MTLNALPIRSGDDEGSKRDEGACGSGDAPASAGVTLLKVEAEGRSWLVKHNSGVLGRVADRDEAIQLASGLAAWCRSQGRLVSFQAD